MKGQIIVSETTGIDAGVNKVGFRLLNNPVNAFLSYEMDQQIYGDLFIYDMKGVQIHVHQIIKSTGRIRLDIPAGQYVYVLRNQEAELLASGQLIIAR